MKLDKDAVVEALGEKTGRLFFALSRSGVPKNPASTMEPKMREYLSFLEDHLSLEGSADLREFFRMDVALALSEHWKKLLELAEASGDPRNTLLVTTGVRYYCTPHDAESELESRHGYRDDTRVLNWVLEQTGFDLPPLADPGPEEAEDGEASGTPEA